MTTTVNRTVGDGTVWPPRAQAAQLDDGRRVAIYDPGNHAAHVKSDWSIVLEDAA